MRNLVTLLVCMSAGAVLQADTLYLRDGRTLEGTFISGTSRQVRFLARGNTQTFPVTSVDRVSFGSMSSSGYGSSTSTRARNPRAAVPSGTVISVRTIDPINSDKSNIGDSFRASLEDPIVVDGRTIAPKGADVTLRVARVEQAGLTGTEDVSLELAEIRTAAGRTYEVRSTNAQVSAKNRNSENIKIIGGTAVLGAIIGAIAGGGKGAAIGAAAGAGAGAAVQAIRGQRVEIAPESILDFTLAEPLYID
jgi:outer membrane lipoprotein SlyB